MRGKNIVILAYTGAILLDEWKHSYKQTNVWPSQMTKTCKLTSNISNQVCLHPSPPKDRV